MSPAVTPVRVTIGVLLNVAAFGLSIVHLASEGTRPSFANEPGVAVANSPAIRCCFDPEFALWANGLIDNFRREVFRPVPLISAAEIERAPAKARALQDTL